MNTSDIWGYIFVMAIVSFLLRVLPITLIKKQIKNQFVRSVLFYLPYVTLSVMTVPAIFAITDNPIHGIVGFIAACIAAWFTSNMFLSAVVASGAVFVCCLII